MSYTIARIIGGAGFEPQTIIKSGEMNPELNQLVNAHNDLVNTKLERDGTQAMTADLPMGGNRLTNMGASIAAGQAVEYAQWVAANAAIAGGGTPWTGDWDAGGNKLTNLDAATAAGDAVEYQQWLTKNNSQDAAIYAIATGYSRRFRVLSVADNTAAPPSENEGDRYILDTTGVSHAGWDGAVQNDIVQFTGGVWVAYTPYAGYICYVVDVGKDALFVEDGTPEWELRPVIITSHLDLSDIGTKTHTDIDTHIGDATLHFTQAAISIPASQISDFDTEVANNTAVAANTTHSGKVAGENPHNTTKSGVGLGNVTNDAQLKSSQLQTTITDDDTKVPSSGAVVDYVAAQISASSDCDSTSGSVSVGTSNTTVCSLTLSGCHLSATTTSVDFQGLDADGLVILGGHISVPPGSTTPHVALMYGAGVTDADTEATVGNVTVRAELATDTVNIRGRLGVGSITYIMTAGGTTIG